MPHHKENLYAAGSAPEAETPIPAGFFDAKSFQKQARSYLPSAKPKTDKSPEDAMTVIALSELCNDPSHSFTLEEYIEAYNAVRKKYPELGFEELAKNPKSTILRNLYSSARALSRRGLITADKRIYKNVKYLFTLTIAGIAEVDRRRKINDALTEAYVALHYSTKRLQKRMYWDRIRRKYKSKEAAERKIHEVISGSAFKSVGTAIYTGNPASFYKRRKIELPKVIKDMVKEGRVLEELSARTLQAFTKQLNKEELSSLIALVSRVKDVEMRNFPKPLVHRDAPSKFAGKPGVGPVKGDKGAKSAVAAAPKQIRRPDGKFKEAKGKNPEAAWRVIINSPTIQRAIMEKGYFTTSDYREGWKEAAKELGFVLKSTPEEKIIPPANNTIISDLKALNGDKYSYRLSWKFVNRKLRFYVKSDYRDELKYLNQADAVKRSSDVEPGGEARPPVFGGVAGAPQTLPILAGTEDKLPGGGLEPEKPVSADKTEFVAIHKANEEALKDDPLIKIISEYIIRGLNKGPGAEKSLDLEAVYKSIADLNNIQMEIFWSKRKEHGLTETMQNAIKDIGKRRHQQQSVTSRQYENFERLVSMLKAESGAMRIIVTDIPSDESGAEERLELVRIIDAQPELFKNVRFINMEMPDKFEGRNAEEKRDAKTVFQADAVMRAILARLYEPDKTPFVEALLRTMLEGTINCSVDDFLRMLAAAGDVTNLDLSKDRDKATFIKRISLALGHAVKIAEKIGERIRLDKAFWIAA